MLYIEAVQKGRSVVGCPKPPAVWWLLADCFVKSFWEMVLKECWKARHWPRCIGEGARTAHGTGMHLCEKLVRGQGNWHRWLKGTKGKLRNIRVRTENECSETKHMWGFVSYLSKRTTWNHVSKCKQRKSEGAEQCFLFIWEKREESFGRARDGPEPEHLLQGVWDIPTKRRDAGLLFLFQVRCMRRWLCVAWRFHDFAFFLF